MQLVGNRFETNRSPVREAVAGFLVVVAAALLLVLALAALV
jgi:hypothetical protein